MSDHPERDGTEVIWASASLKKNMGNYESIGFDAGARVVGNAYDEEAWAKLWNELSAQLEKKLDEIVGG